MTASASKQRDQSDTDRVVALLERLVANSESILELLGHRSAAETSDEAIVADVIAREFAPKP